MSSTEKGKQTGEGDQDTKPWLGTFRTDSLLEGSPEAAYPSYSFLVGAGAELTAVGQSEGIVH